jgi:hypothetical protein
MATWPSSTKASTDNVDSGSDKPRLARADIKQNIDNTNSIIDMFDISSPSDKNTLVYNSTNSRFETQAATFQEAIIEISNSVSSTDPQIDVESPALSDPHNITTISSGQFTLGVGTYLVWCWTRNGSNNSGLGVRSGQPFELQDPDADPITVISYTGSPVEDGLMFFGEVVVSGSSNTFRVKHNAGFAPEYTSGQIPNDSYLRILKVA